MAGTSKQASMPDFQDMSLPELIALRRKWASAANRQMQRWKAAGMADKASAYKMYAQPYLRMYGPDRATFHTGKKPIAGKTERGQKQAEIRELSALWRYQHAATYSLSGYKKTKQKAMEGLARASGIDPGTPEMERFLSEAADGIVGSDQWTWVKRTLGSDAIKAVARGIAEGRATKAEVIENIKQMQMQEAAEAKVYSELTWEDYIEELGISEEQISEGEE